MPPQNSCYKAPPSEKGKKELLVLDFRHVFTELMILMVKRIIALSLLSAKSHQSTQINMIDR